MNEKDNKEGLTIFSIMTILFLILAVIVIRECVQGTYAFFASKGIGTWLIVIGGLALFVFLVMRADRRN